MRTVIITGVAGLVGQNLVALLARRKDLRLVGIDKHRRNLSILSGLHPELEAICADLAESGGWEASFEDASLVIQLHAQIGGVDPEPFERNNVQATERVLERMRDARIPYLVHISTSAINSAAQDFYTDSKRRQEDLVRRSGICHCVLRPTLMYGWFDPKHLGWLSRFMGSVPVFPIPGHGRYLRQPLYVQDVCRVIETSMDRQPENAVYDLAGKDRIYYVDMMQAIRRIQQLHTPFVHLPMSLFAVLLRAYAIGTKHPPFTVNQLSALTVGDDFPGVDMRQTFGVEPTPFEQGMRETLTHPRYSSILVETYV